MKFADGKTSSANVPHLNACDFDISAAEFPQPKKTRVFGVNRPSACFPASVTATLVIKLVGICVLTPALRRIMALYVAT